MEEMEIFQVTVSDEIIDKWQKIANLLARVINVPAGLIMRIVESDIQVFISSHTDGNPYHPGDSEHLENSGLYCETVIKTGDKLMIPNALKDEHWKNNPDVKLNMISYLGFPLKFPNGKPFGTICVLDNKENHYSDVYVELIESLREIIERDLELLYTNALLGADNKMMSDYIDEIKTLRGLMPICSLCKKVRKDDGYWIQLESYLKQHSDLKFSHSLCEECAEKIYGETEWYQKLKAKKEKK